MAFHADKRGKAAELNAAGVRVVILAVMFLMSMVDPAIMDRWPLHRKPSVTAQHSATFRQSQTLMQSPHRCMNTAGNCRPGIVRLLFYQQLMIDGNIISPQARRRLSRHHPPPILTTSKINVHHPISGASSHNIARAHRNDWNSYGYVKQNAKMKQRVDGSASWGQISHYLPHQPS